MIFLILLLCFNVCVLAADSDGYDLPPPYIDSSSGQVVLSGADSDGDDLGDCLPPQYINSQGQGVLSGADLGGDDLGDRRISSYTHSMGLAALRERTTTVPQPLGVVAPESGPVVLDSNMITQLFERGILRNQPDFQGVGSIERRECACMEKTRVCFQEAGQCGLEACDCVQKLFCVTCGNVVRVILADVICITTSATACICCPLLTCIACLKPSER